MLPMSLLSFSAFKTTAHHEKRLCVCGRVASSVHNLGVIPWFICINEEKILASKWKDRQGKNKKESAERTLKNLRKQRCMLRLFIR